MPKSQNRVKKRSAADHSKKQKKARQPDPPPANDQPEKGYWWERHRKEPGTEERAEAELSWDMFDRKEALEQELAEWKADRTTDLATRKARQSQLQEQFDEISGLLRGSDPSKWGHLKRWYFDSTPEQRNAWLEGRGPNLPSEGTVNLVMLANIQRAYDECRKRHRKATQEAVSSLAGVARSTVQRYWGYIDKK